MTTPQMQKVNEDRLRLRPLSGRAILLAQDGHRLASGEAECEQEPDRWMIRPDEMSKDHTKESLQSLASTLETGGRKYRIFECSLCSATTSIHYHLKIEKK